MAKLSLSNVHYRYQEKAVMNGLDLTITHNDIVALLGASGCGKTTTLKAVAGLITPEQGCISIDGHCVSEPGHFTPPEARNIGMMFQDYALFPHLTVAQNVAFGLKGLTKTEQQARVTEMLTLVRLNQEAARYPHELSGGQQQRVAIARALAYQPKLLLLDEPFSNIDPHVRYQLIAELRAILKAQQVPALFVTHSKEEAFAFADKLAIMAEGNILQLDSAEALYHHPNCRAVAEFLAPGIYLDAQLSNSFTATTAWGDIISLTPFEQALGSTGQVYIRPQHIKLASNQGVNCQLQATVLQRRFAGTHYTYRVDTPQGVVEVNCQQPSPFSVGQQVNLSVEQHPVSFFSH